MYAYKPFTLNDLGGLNEDENEVVHESTFYKAEGLLQGRAEHGELRLDSDRRDFANEAGMELRDGTTYLAAERVRARRGGNA